MVLPRGPQLNPESEPTLPAKALQHSGQIVCVCQAAFGSSARCDFSIFPFQVCKPCPQSALTTGRFSTWKVQSSFFTAEQALKGSISAVTGQGLFSSTLLTV